MKKNNMPKNCMEDTVSFLMFYYPHILAEEWRYDVLIASDKFQNPSNNTDCGFHILNFMHAAVNDTRVPTSSAEFNKFKSTTDITLQSLCKPQLKRPEQVM